MKDARDMLAFLASGCEKLAGDMKGNFEIAASRLPEDASEFNRGYLEGYAAGRAKSYQDMAEDYRKVLRDNPPSAFNWPRISLGFSWRF